MVVLVSRLLPVEEGLFALRIQPLNVVEMQIVPITMSWINLFTNQ